MPIERLRKGLRISDAAFLDALAARGSASASELAADVGCTDQNARNRLKYLEAAGRVVACIEHRPRHSASEENGTWAMRVYRLPGGTT